MQGRKDDHEKLITSFQLSSCIPKHNFYRRLKEMLDLIFLYEHTRDAMAQLAIPRLTR